jgi:hypothetical protein
LWYLSLPLHMDTTSGFRVATWLCPSYNGWPYNNGCCPQFFTLSTSFAFVWDVDSRDQYGGGGGPGIVAVSSRFHLRARRM